MTLNCHAKLWRLFMCVCLSVHLPIRMYHHTRQDTDRESMTESLLVPTVDHGNQKCLHKLDGSMKCKIELLLSLSKDFRHYPRVTAQKYLKKK